MPILDRRRPTQRRPERRVVDDGDDANNEDAESELPPYEPLACPLSIEAKRAIADLSNSRDVHRYQNHIKASHRHLSQSVVGINDAARDRAIQLQRLREKRAEADGGGGLQEKSNKELSVESHLGALEAEVPGLTADIEAALRDLIDKQVVLEDEKAALAQTVDYFQRLPAAPPPHRRPRRRERRQRQQNGELEGENGAEEEAEEEEEDDPAPPAPEKSVIDILRQHRVDKAREYEKLGAYQRYALNNDYAAFKKLWHDAAHGDSGPPLPNAKRWFDDAGNPVMPRPSYDVKNGEGGEENESGGGGGGAEDDDDEDLVIAGEVRDYTCPLSMMPLTEPYSNRLCSHTYEKHWIFEFLHKSPSHRAECPVAGCSRVISLDDLYFDEVILRKIKRARETQRRAEEEEEEEEEDEGEEEEEANSGDGTPGQVKSEKRSKRGKRKVEEIIDDDDDDDVGEV